MKEMSQNIKQYLSYFSDAESAQLYIKYLFIWVYMNKEELNSILGEERHEYPV